MRKEILLLSPDWTWGEKKYLSIRMDTEELLEILQTAQQLPVPFDCEIVADDVRIPARIGIESMMDALGILEESDPEDLTGMFQKVLEKIDG